MKQNIPLVSVIVVCYNHEKFISECIHSIMHQTYSNIEVIVFDNGSTDNSAIILKKLQISYNFMLICQDNIGVTKTLNQAIKMAKGKYISPMSTDDFWPLDKIEICVKYLENCDSKIVVCGGNCLVVDEFSNVLRKQTFSMFHELDFNDVFVDGLIVPALSTLIKRESLIEVGCYDTNIQVEDYLMWLKITSKGYRIAYLNNLLGYYRHHNTNVSLDHKSKIEWMEYCISQFAENDNYKRAKSNLYLKQFAYYSKVNRLLALQLIFKMRVNVFTKKFIIAMFYFLMPRSLVRLKTNVL